jgi:hypothetical protein
VAETGTPFLLKLPEADRLHFRNLALIRPQLPTERQLELIESLARNLASPRLLTLISRTPHWLVHMPVLQALAANEGTPEPIRRDLELAVALFALMREMEKAPEDEKDERAEAVKALYQQLPKDLKPIVKQLAKQMAKAVSSSGTTLELPPLPVESPDWEALTLPPVDDRPAPAPRPVPVRERAVTAESTLIQEDLQRLLLDEAGEVRCAALRNPALSEEALLASLVVSTNPDLFEDVYQEARWYFKDAVRLAVVAAPLCPSAMARRVLATRDLVGLLETGSQDRRLLHRVVSLFTQAEESEYQYLTFWAKRKAPAMLRVIKVFFDRLQRRRVNQASGLSPVQAEGRWLSLEERVFQANQATQPDQFLAALKDADPQVFSVALENPGLHLRELLAVIPGLDTAKAERLARHTGWNQHPVVLEGLLHNPHLGEEAAMRLLRALEPSPRVILDLLRDPRVQHMAVKEAAVVLLREAYGAMAIPQRIVALRVSGGELMRHLQAEVLKDEDTLRMLVADRQLDPTILLRLARNKQTPRSILELIAGHPVLMAHPAVMTELLLNPKTPREASTRIWGVLSESEQEQLLRSPHLPTALRALA